MSTAPAWWIWLIGGGVVAVVNVVDFSPLVALVGLRWFQSGYLMPEHVPDLVNVYARSMLTILIGAATLALIAWRRATDAAPSRDNRWWSWLVALAIIGYILTFTVLSYRRYMAFNAYHDMAANLEVLWNVMQGGSPVSTAEGTFNGLPVMNWFGIHFTPIVYVFAALLWPFPYPASVFLVQALLLGSGAIPIYLLTTRVTGRAFPAAALTLAYLLYPTLEYTNLYEFEFFRFATPLLLWGSLFLFRRRYALAGVFMMLALMTREDATPAIAALGIYAAWSLKQRAWGTAMTVAAIAYGGAVYGPLRQIFRGPEADFVTQTVYGNLGDTAFQVGWYLLTHPVQAFAWMFSPLKLVNVLLLLLPLGFLSLWAPGLLAVALTGLMIPLSVPDISQSTIFLHKFATAIPFVFVSAVFGIQALAARLAHRWGTASLDRALSVLAVYVLTASILSNVLYGPSPLSRQFWDPTYRVGDFKTHSFHRSIYEVTAHDRIAHGLLGLVPPSAVVSAEHFFLAHLYDRRKLYTFPVVGDDVTHVVIDRTHPNKRPQFNPVAPSIPGPTWGLFQRVPDAVYRMFEISPSWQKVAGSDGVEVFRRR